MAAASFHSREAEFRRGEDARPHGDAVFLIFKDEILDVCVNGEKTATFHVPKEEARTVSFTNEFGSMALKSFTVSPLK